MDAAIGRILAAAKGAGLRAGIHCGGPDYAGAAIVRGFDLVTRGERRAAARRGGRASVARTREVAGPGRAGRERGRELLRCRMCWWRASCTRAGSRCSRPRRG